MCVSVCDSTFALCPPPWRGPCMSVRAICFLLSLCRRDDGLALLCMSTCCMRRCWLAARAPHLSSVSSLHFLSRSLSARAQKTQFNVRLTFKRAFRCTPPPLTCSLSSRFPFFFGQFEKTEVFRAIAIDFFGMQERSDD